MFSNTIPRKYVVKLRERGGQEHQECVTAYDLFEAMIAAPMQAKARGVVEPEVVGVTPDLSAIAQDQLKASVESVFRKVTDDGGPEFDL